jgi:two-component system, NtrC family, response regulator AtoC
MNKKRVIFIVEDDPGFNMVMTNYLTSKNKWEIHSFESGESCLEKLNLKPEIFIQDIDLPGINGIEVMQRVKQLSPKTEFIFLSAQTDIKVVVDAIQLGAFDYVVKDNFAKENTLNKIDQVVKIMNLSDEKRIDKKSNSILFIMLLALLLALGVVWFYKS